MTLRPLHESDVVAIAEIYNYYIRTSTATFETIELSNEQMRSRLFDSFPDYPCIVAEESGNVVGYCAIHSWRPRFDNVAEVTMYISPQYCSRGIGRQMLRQIIETSKKNSKLNGLIACVNANNDHSKALLTEFGFLPTGYYRKVARKFDQWLDDVDFQLLF